MVVWLRSLSLKELGLKQYERPSMRFVETKTPEQQSCLMLHRTRN